jgi:hypothetical protein
VELLSLAKNIEPGSWTEIDAAEQEAKGERRESLYSAMTAPRRGRSRMAEYVTKVVKLCSREKPQGTGDLRTPDTEQGSFVAGIETRLSSEQAFCKAGNRGEGTCCCYWLGVC